MISVSMKNQLLLMGSLNSISSTDFIKEIAGGAQVPLLPVEEPVFEFPESQKN